MAGIIIAVTLAASQFMIFTSQYSVATSATDTHKFIVTLKSIQVANIERQGYYPTPGTGTLVSTQIIIDHTKVDVPFVAVFSILDASGVVINLQTVTGILPSKSQDDEVASATVFLGHEGPYDAKVFLLTDFEKPEILSDIQSTHIDVFTGLVKIPELVDSDSGDTGLNNTNGNIKNTPASPMINASYTFMVYMVGSELESRGYFATKDIKEMMSVGSTEDLNIIIETGGSAHATRDETRLIDFTTVQRHKVLKDDIELLENKGQVNMGESATLSDFLVYGKNNFPAENYIIVLWNDGGGINGYGTDSISSDYLDLSEITQAFSDAKNKTAVSYDLIGFDACLMSSIEIVTRMSSYGSYLVSSEELEPGTGWDYQATLRSLIGGSGLGGPELGKIIVDSYAKSVATNTLATDQSDESLIPQTITMSVVDLSKANELHAAFSDFSSQFGSQLHTFTEAHKFAKSIIATERYGLSAGLDSGHSDLADLTQNIVDKFPELDEVAERLMRAIDDAVIYSVSGELHPNSSGISVYLAIEDPAADGSYDQGVTDYLLGNWKEVNRKQTELMQSDSIPPRFAIKYKQNLISAEIIEDDVSTIQIGLFKEVIDNSVWQLVSLVEDDIAAQAENASMALHLGSNFKYPFGKEIISLCNDDAKKCVPVSLYRYFSGDTKYGIVPARLETNTTNLEVSLLYKLDSENPSDFVFIGAWPGEDENGNAVRELLPLTKGDKIYPTSYQSARKSGEKYNKFVWPDVIEVSDGFGLTFHDYKARYILSIGFCDYSGNCRYSEELVHGP